MDVPAVKLSDNPNKAIGTPSEIDAYFRVFGAVGQVKRPVLSENATCSGRAIARLSSHRGS